MKKSISLILLACMLIGILSGCGPTPDPTVPSSTAPSGTTPDPTEPSATKPNPTEPDPTEPSVTEPDPTEPSATEPVEVEKKPDGLTVVNGRLMKGGEEFYGVGVNYYDMFIGIFYNKWDTSNVMNALDNLKAYDCKVIRFATLPFMAKDMGYYTMVEDTYWSKLDEIVKKCEELEIGLIPSMFWTFSCFDQYGESYQTAIFDENSKGMAFIREYTEKFVQRYAESPAIYGWEFSNEKILSADLPHTVGTSSYYSTDALNHIYAEWAAIVAANDPYDRVISTGDTNPRESQYNQWKNGTWNRDTMEQHLEVMAAINPGDINTVSQHQYSLGSVLGAGDKTAPLFDAKTWKTFFEYLLNVSSNMGKACYVGEAGFALSKDLGWENVTEEHLQAVYDSIGNATCETGMQLVLLWNYDDTTMETDGYVYHQGGGVEYSWNENTTWGRIALEMMKEVNAKLAAGEN